GVRPARCASAARTSAPLASLRNENDAASIACSRSAARARIEFPAKASSTTKTSKPSNERDVEADEAAFMTTVPSRVRRSVIRARCDRASYPHPMPCIEARVRWCGVDRPCRAIRANRPLVHPVLGKGQLGQRKVTLIHGYAICARRTCGPMTRQERVIRGNSGATSSSRRKVGVARIGAKVHDLTHRVDTREANLQIGRAHV